MFDIQQSSPLDYNSLDIDTRVFVQELDVALDLVLKRTAKELGCIFEKAKNGLPHGLYVPWLASKGFSQPTAWRCIQTWQGKEIKSFKMNDLELEVIEPLVEAVEGVEEVRIIRTNEEKRRDVEQFFADFPLSALSNREIAKKCGVTEGMVRAVKKELFPEPVPEPVPIPEPEIYIPPDATSLMLQGTELAEVALEAAIEDTPLIIAPEPEKTDDPEPQEFGNILNGRLIQAPQEFQVILDSQVIGEPTVPMEMIEPMKLSPELRETIPTRNEHVMQVMGSSDSPEWYTPQEIVQLSIALLGEIDLDPCSNSREAPNVPAHNHYTKEDNGLMHPWQKKVYLNPPYGSEIPLWIEKLVASYPHSVTEAIALLPARIDTIWFQPLYKFPMCNVRGRIQYENSPYHAPFPCVIVYLGNRLDAFIQVFGHKGPIMRRIG